MKNVGIIEEKKTELEKVSFIEWFFGFLCSLKLHIAHEKAI